MKQWSHVTITRSGSHVLSPLLFLSSRVGNSRCNYIVDPIMALLAINLLILGTNSIMHCAFN